MALLPRDSASPVPLPPSAPALFRRTAAPDDRFFRHIVSSLRNGVLAIHRDGTLALTNEEACRIFAIASPTGEIGRPFNEVFRHRPELVHILSGAFELTTLPNRAELRLRDTDRVIGYTLSVIRNDAADAIGAIMFFKDLTRVEQQEERERLRDRLASLGEMAAGIAHELKNPLAGIEVMAGLLRRQVPDSPDAQSLLVDIISEAKLANAIVMQMLEFVRPVRLQMERTDIREVLQQAITLAEGKATRGDTTVKMAVAETLPAIDGDHYQLCQVFTNLLINAFEALDGRGQIELTASVAVLEPDPAFVGDTASPTFAVVIDIEDDGPGIPAEARDKIFDPFFTTKVQGSGLGLPIVRKIVDAHEGRIDLASDPGQGTRFRVTIPVSNASSWLGKQVGKT